MLKAEYQVTETKTKELKVPYMSSLELSEICAVAECQGIDCENCLFHEENFRKACEGRRRKNHH